MDLTVIVIVIGVVFLLVGGIVIATRKKNTRDKLIKIQEAKVPVASESTPKEISNKKPSLLPNKDSKVIESKPSASAQNIVSENKPEPIILPKEEVAIPPTPKEQIEETLPVVIALEQTSKKHLEVSPLPQRLPRNLNFAGLGDVPIIIEEDIKPTAKMEVVHMTREGFSPRVQFTAEAYAKIREYVLTNPENEIRGFGTVFVNEQNPEIILIRDIFLPRQIATPTSVVLPIDAMNELLGEITSSCKNPEDGEEMIDHLNCAWHSHVRLAVDPSERDRIEVRQSIFKTDREGNLVDENERIIPIDSNGNVVHNSLFPRRPIPTRDIFVDCIFNLRGEARISVYYPRDFQSYHNVPYSVIRTISSNSILQCQKEQAEKVKKNSSPFMLK